MPSGHAAGWQRDDGSAGMKRPSYLRQIASRAIRTGVAVVAPPRSPFRADAAGGFLETNTPPGDDVPDVSRRATVPSPRTSREAVATNLQPQAAVPPYGHAVHAASTAVREPNARDSQPTAHTPASSYSTIVTRSSAPQMGIDAPPPALAHARQTAAEPTPTQAAITIATPVSAPTLPPAITSRNKDVMRGTPASLEQIAAAARIVTPRHTDTAADRGPIDPRPTDGNRTSTADSPGTRSAPAVTNTRPPLPFTTQETMIRERRVDTMLPAALIPQPTRPPPQAKPEAPGTGLHIGTLEVHLSAPPSTPPQAHPAPQRAARGTAGTARRIARGFGVFGLGQS
jgi:hypothetical protein